jgi:hypothetical protein
MQKIIRNEWRRETGKPYATARILSHEIHPEGLDIERIRFFESGSVVPKTGVGHIVSILKGSGTLFVDDSAGQSFRLGGGVHLYLPPGMECALHADPGTEILKVSSPSAGQARGDRLLLRDEVFVSACAAGSQMLRWAFTPQYLSRRIFLHHDPVLLSKSGDPVSWYRTTMFDVAGLPANDEGEPVFKMSYNSRTECNVCYDVEGIARVRMARHPYRKTNQDWHPWADLDGDSTYHLNEAARSAEEECIIDMRSGQKQYFRNKHEVYIDKGHVTLCCLFDPAPTGIENHRPGEYSDYEPLSQVMGRKEYETHRSEIARYDEMVDRLSLARATGTLGAYHGTSIWELYLEGREAQVKIESEIARNLSEDGNGRERVLARWMQSPAGFVEK